MFGSPISLRLGKTLPGFRLRNPDRITDRTGNTVATPTTLSKWGPPMPLRPTTSLWFGLAVLVGSVAIGTTPARAQFGLAISGVGPINRSMGGAATAAPLDSAGAIYWNPATIG